MLFRLAALLLLAAAGRGCLTYEYEHEFWLDVDGSGTVYVTGRPALWTAFKGLPAGDPTPESVRALFERAGLRVNRATLTRRRGQRNLFISADFDDVNALSSSPAFPDLRIAMKREGDRLRLTGVWEQPAAVAKGNEVDGLMAVRFHLPAKVYEHRHAADGVERGNILAWRQEVARARGGGRLEFGAVMDDRSILISTVTLFGSAILLAAAMVGGVLYLVARQGRKGSAP